MYTEELEFEGVEGWEKLPGWPPTRKGLDLYYKAVLSVLVVAPAAWILSLVLAALDFPKIANVLLALVPLWLIIVQVLVVVGVFKFTNVPTETGAKTLATLAAVAILIAAGLQAIDFLGSVGDAFESRPRFRRSRGDDGSLIGRIGSLISTLGFLFLVLSMRVLSQFIGALRVRRSLNLVLGLLVAFAVWVVLTLVGARLGLSIVTAGILMVAMAVMMIGAGLVFIMAVGNLLDHILTGTADEIIDEIV